MILLDTHIFLWFIKGDAEQLLKAEIDFLEENANHLAISAISVWEIAMLEKSRRIHLHQPLSQWIEIALKNIHVIELSPNIAIESVQLPGELHKDPADRIIIATSRIHNFPLITHDNRILTYGEEGYINLVMSDPELRF